MEEMDATATSEVPQDKSKKYDRQLRLWGDHGQAALEAAKVCLINATATGTEILKNLILPGIGSFTIVDGQKVTGEDVGNNFFLDQSSIGQPRAQATTELLLELNEDVHGDFIEENVDTLLEKNPSFFSNFSIVIASNLRERSLLRLASTLWESDVPLLICRSYGFIGLVRLIVREHTVIESHPSNAFEDLRLDKPFTGLINFCDSLDLDKMDSKDHSHTPWLVVLYKYLQIYKSQHDGTIPRLSKDKNVLKDLIKSGIHRTEENGQMEENFDEAIRNVNTALLPTNVTSEVQAIFNDESCVNLHSESKPFWILARAVKNFVEQEGKGLLPLRGSIPDMTSDSTRFIALQKVYHEQAELDVTQVSAHVQKILESLGRVRGDEPLSMERINQQKHSPASSPGKPQDHISDEDIKTFCKNSAFLRVIRCRPLSSEHEGPPSPSLTPHLDDQEQPDDALWYVLMRAVDRFEGEHNRYPGSDKTSFESDISQLKNCLNKLMQEWSITNNIKDDYIHEMCRYGNAELHSVASFIGGVAAQEAIKIVTNQFIPINNTFIYNAANQTSITLEL